MRQTVYIVTSGIQWKVKCPDGKEYVKGTQHEAIQTAKSYVASLRPGSISQIVIQGRDSQFRTEWTYGKDPFPPKG